jgi:hypothetical protein
MGVDSIFGIVTILLESALNAHLAQAFQTVECLCLVVLLVQVPLDRRRGHPDSRQEVAKTNGQESKRTNARIWSAFSMTTTTRVARRSMRTVVVVSKTETGISEIMQPMGAHVNLYTWNFQTNPTQNPHPIAVRPMPTQTQ